jgi:hypothetical protein
MTDVADEMQADGQSPPAKRPIAAQCINATVNDLTNPAPPGA